MEEKKCIVCGGTDKFDHDNICYNCIETWKQKLLSSQKAELKQMIDKMMEIPLRHISLKCKCWQSRDCASVIAVELLDHIKKHFEVA